MCQRKRAQSLRIGHSQGNLSFYEINRLMRLQEGELEDLAQFFQISQFSQCVPCTMGHRIRHATNCVMQFSDSTTTTALCPLIGLCISLWS